MMTGIMIITDYFSQQGAHHTDHAGVLERGLRGGAWLRPREARLSAEASHRDVLHRAVTQTQSNAATASYLRADTAVSAVIVNPLRQSGRQAMC